MPLFTANATAGFRDAAEMGWSGERVDELTTRDAGYYWLVARSLSLRVEYVFITKCTNHGTCDGCGDARGTRSRVIWFLFAMWMWLRLFGMNKICCGDWGIRKRSDEREWRVKKKEQEKRVWDGENKDIFYYCLLRCLINKEPVSFCIRIKTCFI